MAGSLALFTAVACGGGASISQAEATRTIDETLADTVERVDAADVTEDGSGVQRCEADPEDEVTYDAGVRITVADDQIDATVEEAWAYWQDIGFEADGISIGDEEPDVHARRDGYWGAIIGNRQGGFVSIGISSPCANAR